MTAVAWIVVAFVTAAQQGTPRPPRTGLQIRVSDSGGRAVPNAAIALDDGSGRAAVRATTSADGIAYVPDLGAGDYAITAVAADGRRAIGRIRVQRAAVATLDLVLPGPAAAPTAPTGPPRPPGIVTPAPESAAPQMPLSSGVPATRASASGAASPLPPDDRVFVPRPDRWSIALPEWERRTIDPYNRNKWKGDYPIIGQRTFFAFNGVSDTLFEGANLPTSAGVSPARPFSERFFGLGGRYLPVAVVRTSFDLFHGDTAFRPVDWRVRVQAAFSANALRTQETGIVNADTGEGHTRVDSHLGLQEAFVEKKLIDVGSHFDFVSVRAGIQELNTDFRGFIAAVEQPGIRVFGTLASNRIEFNAAVFDFLEKDTNSGFNEFSRRRQQMAVANVYVQDFLTPGYTTAFSVHYSRDAGERLYDRNGFLVRPAPIGAIASREVRSAYLGWAGSGHLGRLNISHAFYQVLGTDENNPIAARPVDINAQMAAIEVSRDDDWLREKAGVFWASGDGDVADGRARGFDAILDAPVFASAPFGAWNREGLRLPGTGTGLISPLSLLPSLRTNRDEGKQNFVNPGVLIVFGGADAKLTPKLRAFANVSGMWFGDTAALETLLFQAPVHRTMGLDFGGGAQYRPFLNENVTLLGGFSAMRLAQGLRDIYDRRYVVAAFTSLRLQF